MNDQLNKNKILSKKSEKKLRITKDEKEESKPTIEYDSLIYILKKPKNDRSKSDRLQIMSYLCSNIDYFKKLSTRIDKESLLKFISNINYESYNANQRLMTYGEEGNKFFIILKGSVTVLKPCLKEQLLTMNEYMNYIIQIRDVEKNEAKLNRVVEYNSKDNKAIMSQIENDEQIDDTDTKKLPYVIEEEKEVDVLYKGEVLGEMELIRNMPWNYSIVTEEKCDLLSVEKNDYSKIKTVEEQRIQSKLADFRNDFPMFKFWSNSKCFKLVSGFITQNYNKGDYIYKQNEIPDSLYFIKEGIVEVYTEYNFCWYEKFIDYIYDNAYSLINDIDNPNLWKEEKIQRKIYKVYKEYKSPCILKKTNYDKIIVSSKVNEEEENNILGQSLNEEQNKNFQLVKQLEKTEENAKKYLYRANIQKLQAPQIFGYIEALDIKRRFCTIKCFSKNAIIYKFPFMEFVSLLPTDKTNQFYLQQSMFEEKKHLIEQLTKNALAKLNFMKLNNLKNKIMKYFDMKAKMKGSSNLFKFTNSLINRNRSEYFNESNSMNNLAQTQLDRTENNKKYEIFNLKSQLNREKFNETNGLNIPNFKKTIIKLTKKKFEDIKKLYPQSTKRNNSTFKMKLKKHSVDNDNYMKLFENNKLINKTPSKFLSSISMVDLTARKYHNFESHDKIVQKLKEKKDNNKTFFNKYIILPNMNKQAIKLKSNK